MQGKKVEVRPRRGKSPATRHLYAKRIKEEEGLTKREGDLHQEKKNGERFHPRVTCREVGIPVLPPMIRKGTNMGREGPGRNSSWPIREGQSEDADS